MEALDGPDAADSCACCQKLANKRDKLKNWWDILIVKFIFS
jgi:hypothetical protein